MSYGYQKRKKKKKKSCHTNYTSLDNPTPNTREGLSTFCYTFLEYVNRGSVVGKKECNYPCQCLNRAACKSKFNCSDN